MGGGGVWKKWTLDVIGTVKVRTGGERGLKMSKKV